MDFHSALRTLTGNAPPVAAHYQYRYKRVLLVVQTSVDQKPTSGAT